MRASLGEGIKLVVNSFFGPVAMSTGMLLCEAHVLVATHPDTQRVRNDIAAILPFKPIHNNLQAQEMSTS